MSEIDGIDELDLELETLEVSLGQTSALVAGFDGELRRMQQSLSATGQDVVTLEKGLSRGLRKAFDGLVFDGMKLSDALETVAQGMADAAYRAALKPITDQVGSVVATGIGGVIGTLLPFAQGAGFSQGRVMPFANGGVVSGPMSFPMRGGIGLMGEAGPEAIMPLMRGNDGKLGVRGGGGSNVNIVMHISTPDVAGFRRSQGQVAAQMSRVLSRGQRNR